MTVLYGHRFSSYTQKVLIAFHEKEMPFNFRTLEPEAAEAMAEWQRLWPLARFPVLRTADRTLGESSVIIEWVDRHPGPRLIPADPDQALEVRMFDRIFDNHVMTPMQAIVFDRLRPAEARDAYGVDRARAALDTAYRWLDAQLDDGRDWVAAGAFGLADCAAAPALFYADWVHPFGDWPALTRYFQRLMTRPSFARCVEEARPYRKLFPGGAPTA